MQSSRQPTESSRNASTNVYADVKPMKEISAHNLVSTVDPVTNRDETALRISNSNGTNN